MHGAYGPPSSACKIMAFNGTSMHVQFKAMQITGNRTAIIIFG
jgi:hypothetical protein